LRREPEGQDNLDFITILVKEGTTDILEEARDGFKSGKDVIRRLGLGQKVYYARLGELRRIGLVRRDGLGVYNLTDRGLLALDLKERLGRALSQGMTSLPVESRVLNEYAEMVATLCERIESAKKRVKLATRYVDTAVAKATFDAMDRNVSVQVIYKQGKTHLGEMALELLGMVRNGIDAHVRELWGNTRVSDIPFSFTVVDGHWSGIELVTNDQTFVAALEFEGWETARVLSLLFRHYYRIGTVFPRFW